jgi:uncharacterized peroxidase-related enzyme
MTRPTRFTMQTLEWVPWIETVNEIGLSESELREIYEQAPNARGSSYFATLALDLPALVQRTGLFNSTMRSPGGASNSERELAATVTSLINGCIYCTSVHAQRYVQYAKKPEVMEQLLASESVRAESLADPREAAILDLSVSLIGHEAPAVREAITRMHEMGFSDLEIYDIGQSAAMFAWANRLMQTLGEPAESVSGF